ncbi:OmpA family protein [Octadecabacter sp.]|nr:OmpA family protein [Octadecabacter sp.]
MVLSLWGGLSQINGDLFQFSRGSSFAASEENRLRGLLSQALPDERIHITIVAHTGNSGDASANLALSEDRAELVYTIATNLGIDAYRITARGVGGSAPLPKSEGESDRAYQSRLARVEVSLQMRK